MKLPRLHRVPESSPSLHRARARASASTMLVPAETASLACLEQYAGAAASQCMRCGPDADCWARCASLSPSAAAQVVSCYGGSYNLM